MHPLKVEANGVWVVNPRVSTGLRVDFAGLPEDAELANRFLIGHAHGIGPATVLGVIVLEQGVEAIHWSEADQEISRVYRLLLRDNPDPTIPPSTIALSVLQAGQVQDDRDRMALERLVEFVGPF